MLAVTLIGAWWLALLLFAWALARAAGRPLPSPGRCDAENGRVAWWRIVPRHRARDEFARRFVSREDAEITLALIGGRGVYEVVAFDREGKRLHG